MLLPSAPILHAETAADKEARMKWFNEARFGMFIHWGVYSGAAGNFKGKPAPGAGEWLQSGGKIPAKEYRGAKAQSGKDASWMGNASNPNPDMDRFTAYLKGQFDELITAYHPDILWFDGEWEPAWKQERGVDLYNCLRAKDPALIINNRVDKERKGMEGHAKGLKFKGGHGTPEQQIPATGFGEGVSQESCMTMNGNRGFKQSDPKRKSAETLGAMKKPRYGIPDRGW